MKFLYNIIALLTITCSLNAQIDGVKIVGGAAMYANKTITENVVKSKDHTTLIEAVKVAGLVETLNTDGPFTVFAPTNRAFEKLPTDALSNLNMPINKEKLSAVILYHIIPGKISTKDILLHIKEGRGKATFTSSSGATLTAVLVWGKIILKDEKGGSASISIENVNQKNGYIHVIDSVLMPK